MGLPMKDSAPQPTPRRTVDVSVVIATFNREGLVAESVESVLAQTVRPREVIVVDDGSSDRTDEVLRPYVERGLVRFIVLPENRGQAAAFNEGIRAAAGEWIAVCSSDDLWLPNKLELQMAALQRMPDAGLVYGNMFNWNVDAQSMRVRAEGTLPEGDLYEAMAFRRIFMSWITVVVRRSCLDEVGLFDERLRRHEDRDLSVRLTRRYTAAVVQQPVAIVRLHGDANPKHEADTFPFAEWIAWERMLLDKIVAEETDSARVRRLEARYAYVWARGYLSRGEGGEALKLLAKAIRTWPLDPKPYLFLPAALVARRGRELHGG